MGLSHDDTETTLKRSRLAGAVEIYSNSSGYTVFVLHMPAIARSRVFHHRATEVTLSSNRFPFSWIHQMSLASSIPECPVANQRD